MLLSLILLAHALFSLTVMQLSLNSSVLQDVYWPGQSIPEANNDAEEVSHSFHGNC